jgi:hypothetical protein
MRATVLKNIAVSGLLDTRKARKHTTKLLSAAITPEEDDEGRSNANGDEDDEHAILGKASVSDSRGGRKR